MKTHGYTSKEWDKSRGQETILTLCGKDVPREPWALDGLLPTCQECAREMNKQLRAADELFGSKQP